MGFLKSRLKRQSVMRRLRCTGKTTFSVVNVRVSSKDKYVLNDTGCHTKFRKIFSFQLENHDLELSELKFALDKTNANLAERNRTYSKVRTFF